MESSLKDQELKKIREEMERQKEEMERQRKMWEQEKQELLSKVKSSAESEKPNVNQPTFPDPRLAQMKAARAHAREPARDSTRVRAFGALFMYKILTIFTRTRLRRGQGCARARNARARALRARAFARAILGLLILHKFT